VASTGDGLFEAVDNPSSLIPCGHSVLLKRNVDNHAGAMPPSTMGWLDVGVMMMEEKCQGSLLSWE